MSANESALAGSIALTRRIDLLRSLSPLISSAQDPTIRIRRDGFARASHTPAGHGTLVVEGVRGDDRRYSLRAYGPGAQWLLERAPGLLGAHDADRGFVPQHPTVARAHHRHPGLRLVATGTVADVLVATIIAQRVTSLEAGRSWTRLVRRHGSEAPGPYHLLLPPHPSVLARTSEATYHALGIERGRARRIIQACRYVPQLDAALGLPATERQERWRSVPGIGPWTAALLSRLAAGDPDAVEIGDHHVKHLVSWNLAGEPRGSDERMCSLLAPYAGQRGRVVRLLGVGGQPPPRYGARTAPSAAMGT
jgi:endonuclease III